MAGRGIDEIIQLILGAPSKPLAAAEVKAATSAVKKLAKPATVSSLKSGAVINIPKIPTTKVTKGILDPIGYSGVKLSRPIESYGPRTVASNQPLLPEKTFSLSDIVGDYIIPTYWDRSQAGETLLGVGDVNLQRGYEMGGGFGFMRGPAAQADRAMTASDKGVISAYDRLTEEAAQKGKKLHLFPLTMPADALDFQGTTSRVSADLLQQTDPEKSVLAAFNAEMKNRVPDFPGLMSADLDAFLAAATPDERKAFIRFVGSEDAAALGINTDLAGAARYAFTDPSQRLTTPGYGGYGVAKLEAGPNAIVASPTVPHSDFASQMRGEYMGRLALPQHESVLFPDAYAVYNQQITKAGIPLNSAQKSYALGRQRPMQPVTQQMADEYDAAVEYARQLGLIP
jgi:hypothetical protein